MANDVERALLADVAKRAFSHGLWTAKRRFRADHDDKRSIIDALVAQRLLTDGGEFYAITVAGLATISRHEDYAREEWKFLLDAIGQLRSKYKKNPDERLQVQQIATQWTEEPNRIRRVVSYLIDQGAILQYSPTTGAIEQFSLAERILDIKLEDLERLADPPRPSPPPGAPPEPSAVPVVVVRALREDTFGPEAFGPWLLSRRGLGRGGQAAVTLVRHVDSGERGALKRLQAQVAVTDKGRERFRREIEAFQTIEHLFVLRILDHGNKPEPFLVGEYVELGSLWDNRAGFKGDALRCLRLTRAVAQGLEQAHAAGIVHRDVKPKNILLKTLDHPVVADFGIAHFETEEGITSLGSNPRAFKYAPPESELDHHEPSNTFDVFSLGAVLHCVLSGEEPNRPYRNMPTVPLTGIPEVDAFIGRLLEKDPHKRPQSMKQVVELIDEITADMLKNTRRLRQDECHCGGILRKVGNLQTGDIMMLSLFADEVNRKVEWNSLNVIVIACGKCGMMRLQSDGLADGALDELRSF